MDTYLLIGLVMTLLGATLLGIWDTVYNKFATYLGYFGVCFILVGLAFVVKGLGIFSGSGDLVPIIIGNTRAIGGGLRL